MRLALRTFFTSFAPCLVGKVPGDRLITASKARGSVDGIGMLISAQMTHWESSKMTRPPISVCTSRYETLRLEMSPWSSADNIRQLLPGAPFNQPQQEPDKSYAISNEEAFPMVAEQWEP